MRINMRDRKFSGYVCARVSFVSWEVGINNSVYIVASSRSNFYQISVRIATQDAHNLIVSSKVHLFIEPRTYLLHAREAYIYLQYFYVIPSTAITSRKMHVTYASSHFR